MAQMVRKPRNIKESEDLRDALRIAEDVRFMLDAGEYPERIAQRLGMSPEALSKRLYNLGDPSWTAFERGELR